MIFGEWRCILKFNCVNSILIIICADYKYSLQIRAPKLNSKMKDENIVASFLVLVSLLTHFIKFFSVCDVRKHGELNIHSSQRRAKEESE